MMFRSVSFLIITLFISVNVNAQWVQKNPLFGKPVAYSLLDMKNIWLGDQSGIITHVDLKTHKAKVMGNLKTEILKMSFVDSLNGFVISTSNECFATSDGGKTWVLQNLVGEYFLSKDTWFRTGNKTSGTYDILRTIDGGINWDTTTAYYAGGGSSGPELYKTKFVNINFGFIGIQVSGGAPRYVTTRTLCSVNFLNNTSVQIKSSQYDITFDMLDQNIWAYIAEGVLYQTANGGTSFNTYSIPNYISSLELLSKDIFYAVGYPGNIDSKVSIQKTTDHGATWQTISNLSFLRGYYPELKMFDELNGALVDIDASNNIFNIYLTTDGGYTWNTAVDFSSQITEDILDIYFENEKNGLAITKSGSIIGTLDEGDTWSVKYTNSLHSLSKVQIFDADTIYAYSREQNNDIHFYYTFDGGKLWNETLLTHSPYSQPYQHLFFLDKLHGWFTGKENKFMYTKDGGRNWKESDVNSRFFSSFFLDTLNGYFTTYSGLYRTSDGAKSMELIYSAPQLINFVYFVNENNGWIFLSGLGIGKTIDGGKTVKIVRPDNDLYYSWVTTHFIDNNNGLALRTGGKIYLTNDAGETWRSEKILNNSNIYLNGIFAQSTSSIWVVGNQGIISHGQISSPTDTTKTDTTKVSPKNYALFQNYPNPFNPSTTIKYSIPDVGTQHAVSVQLKVYDLLGSEVTTLVNEEKSPGNYKVKFDGSNLSSGVYFYSLQAGSFSQTKKLVLIK